MSLETPVGLELSARLCMTLLHSVWQIASLAFLVWVLDRVWLRRSAVANYNVHVAALLLGLGAIPISFALLSSQPSPDFIASIPENPAFTGVPGVQAPSAGSPGNIPAAVEVMPQDQSEPSVPAATRVEAARQHSNSAWQTAMPWVTSIYLIGVLAMLLRLALSALSADRDRRMSAPISDGPLFESIRKLSAQWSLRAMPALAVAEHLVVPRVVGIFRPTILLPAAALTGLSPAEMEMVLMHELAHVRRFDMWVNLAQRLAETILFFNPALWYVSRRISTLREYCCDELACESSEADHPQSRLRYAATLVKVAELAGTGERAVGDAALAALGRSPSELRRRVLRLIDEPAREHLRISRSGLLATGAVVLLTLAGPTLWQSTADERTADVSADPVRTLVFPDDRPVGVVFSRPAQSGGFGFLGNWYGDWERVGPAQGVVTVPADHHVQLDVSKSASADLSFLRSLDGEAIDSLNLEASDIDDEQLEFVGALTGVRLLRLEQTRITDRGFRHLRNLERVERLDLSAVGVNRDGFGVGDPSMAVMSRFPSLESVSLRLTKVTDDGMAELAKCASLRSVDVAGTSVSDRGLDHLSQMPTLESLSLGVYDEGANVTDDGIKTIGNMPQLRFLDLSGVPITNAALTDIAKLTQLKELSIENTQVSEDGLAILEPLTSLERLRCDSITDVGARHLSRLNGLKRISTSLDVSDVGVAMLAKLPRLERLSLSDDLVTDASLESIAAMPNLKRLWLQNCRVTDGGLSRLTDTASIEELLINGTEITTDALEHLSQLPNLRRLILGIEPVDGFQSDWRDLRRLTQVTDLRLMGLEIRNRDLANVGELRQLTRLQLNMREPLTDEGISHLATLSNLTDFRTGNAVVTGEGLKALKNMRQLEYLELQTVASDKDLEALKGLTSLRFLQIASLNATDEGVASLAESMSSLQRVSHSTYRLYGEEVTRSKEDGLLRVGNSEERSSGIGPLEGHPPPTLHVNGWINAAGVPIEVGERAFRPKRLSDYRGQVVLVDFWGKWCGPCLDEIPALKSLYERYKGSGLEIVGVHSTSRSDDLNKFVAEHEIGWPIAVDIDKRTKDAWHAPSYPTYYLIDRSGNVRMAGIERHHIETAVNLLLQEPRPVGGTDQARLSTDSTVDQTVAPEEDATQIAIDGYCIVSAVDHQIWIKGEEQLFVVHKGQRYIFLSEEEKLAFARMPHRYAPVFDGKDVVIASEAEGTSEQRKLVDGTQRFAARHNDRTFLFSTMANMMKFFAQPEAYAHIAPEADPQFATRERERVRQTNDMKARRDSLERKRGKTIAELSAE